ncbi:MAG: tRNA (cmo5U34)-methyltransferase [Patescibacteria group bacterium]|nr:tRNA (cmo5U34)-methyltransferase [Patescibacteria group bacterium]
MTHPTSSSPFEKHPAFNEEDHRQFRVWNPVTREVLEKKHRALLPEWLVKGKRVLDLGSCLGATGQWCLHYGALSYTGVETQPEYAEASKNFLSHWEDRAVIVEAPIVDFLKKNVEKFDIVCMFGVLYAFVDYYRILSMASEASNEYVLIETLYPT